MDSLKKKKKNLLSVTKLSFIKDHLCLSLSYGEPFKFLELLTYVAFLSVQLWAL